MKKSTQTALISAVAIVAIMLIAGCAEQDLSSTKKTRLIASDNIQLKKQLQQCNKEIEKQKKLLDECLQAKKVLQQDSQKDIGNLVANIFEGVAKENTNLRDENEKLKAQIEKLKSKLEEADKK